MTEYRHHVSGFFVKLEEAQLAFSKLADQGIPAGQLRIYDNQSTAREPATDAKSNTVLKSMIVDGAVGAAVGTGIGVVAEVALVVANVSLFIASPLLAPLAMLGWGASLGGVVGAMIGSENTDRKDGKFADLVQDAIANGQVVLVAHTRSEQETAIAQDVIKEALGPFQEVRTV